MTTDCEESVPRRQPLRLAAPALTPFRLLGDIALTIAGWSLRGSDAVLTWLERDRHRRRLDRLSDHTMKDIGLGRIDLDRGWHRLL